jgi:hypothetical protein
MSAVMTENLEIGEILFEVGVDSLLVDENLCRQLTIQMK